MIDPFEQLIEQLSLALDVPLHVDAHAACLLRVHNQLNIQLQMDPAQEKVLMASFLIELPPGRFRENVLAEALKTNNLPDPRPGILGYFPLKSSLTMHQRYSIAILTGEKLAALLGSFIDYAEEWLNAVTKGQPSPAPIAPRKSAIPPNSRL